MVWREVISVQAHVCRLAGTEIGGIGRRKFRLDHETKFARVSRL